MVIHHLKLYLLACYKLKIIVCNKTFIYRYIYIYIYIYRERERERERERDFRIRDNVVKFRPYLTIDQID